MSSNTKRLKIGISACFFHPDNERPIFKGKTLQYIEQSVAHWVMSQGDLAVMIPSPEGDTQVGDAQITDYADWLDGVVLMGGAFGTLGHGGNMSPVAEANIHGDPHAADLVATADWPVTFVGLDVTHQIRMSTAYLDEIEAARGFLADRDLKPANIPAPEPTPSDRRVPTFPRRKRDTRRSSRSHRRIAAPAASTRSSSPAETMSKPQPASASSFFAVKL